MLPYYVRIPLVSFLAASAGALETPPPAAPPAPLRTALEAELTRSMAGLTGADEPPYFLSYTVYDLARTRLTAAFGAFTDETTYRHRLLVVEARVGSYEFDNTHRIRGDGGSRFRSSRPVAVELPLTDDEAAIRAVVWRATDRAHRQAVEALARARANHDVKVAAEDQSADFSREKPRRHHEAKQAAELDTAAWIRRLERLSAPFRAYPLLIDGQATLEVLGTHRTIVNSEGARVETYEPNARVALSASSKAADGMDLARHESFFAFAASELPDDDELLAAGEAMIADLEALRAAPVMEPFTGPAILTGRSAGVFFHEIFGHRIEGHRQKDEEEGQTFTRLVGESVLPDFLSVSFDPTRQQIGPSAASGFYRYDDEGVEARAVKIVEDGILLGFLQSRAPIAEFPSSNGHGRRQPGYAAVGRQSNLIVEAKETVDTARLRELLIAEARAQGKEFGLLFADVAGGFTFTGRSTPNSFALEPLLVWRVYVDGRSDELVRGADLIGTPLTAFSKIVAASDAVETFNGVCGAESGWVPVSASSPALLVSQIEVQKKEKSSARPPLLPAPSPTDPKEAE